jgi:hypothetical protein
MRAGVGLGVYSRHAGGMSAVAGHRLAACLSIRHGCHSCRRTYAGGMRVCGWYARRRGTYAGGGMHAGVGRGVYSRHPRASPRTLRHA